MLITARKEHGCQDASAPCSFPPLPIPHHHPLPATHPPRKTPPAASLARCPSPMPFPEPEDGERSVRKGRMD